MFSGAGSSKKISGAGAASKQDGSETLVKRSRVAKPVGSNLLGRIEVFIRLKFKKND